MYQPVRISGPLMEAVALHELKAHLRVDFTDDDDYITAAGWAAREYIESRTGRTLFETTWEIVADQFPPGGCGLLLPMAAPLLSVTTIKYTDSGGAVTTWGSSNYLVNTDALPGIVTPVYGGTWPDYTSAPTGSVRVRYVAGLSLAASPLIYPDETLLWPIRMLVSGIYENRESETLTDKSFIESIAMKYGVEAFINLRKVNHAF
jgi:uncharacterized phiE125 gp8 family phage protein